MTFCVFCREQRAMLASELEKNSDSFSPPETHRVPRTSPAVSVLLLDSLTLGLNCGLGDSSVFL